MPSEPATREELAVLARHAGLDLAPKHFDQLVDAYGHVERMLGRIRRACGYGDEPAHIFVAGKFAHAPAKEK